MLDHLPRAGLVALDAARGHLRAAIEELGVAAIGLGSGGDVGGDWAAAVQNAREYFVAQQAFMSAPAPGA